MASMIHPCHSKCGLWTNSIGIMRSLLDALGPTPGLLSENVHFIKVPREFVMCDEFEEHCSTNTLIDL